MEQGSFWAEAAACAGLLAGITCVKLIARDAIRKYRGSGEAGSPVQHHSC